MKQVKFLLHCVTNGTTRSRVHYSLDSHVSERPCVTLYAKDYDHALYNVISEGYQNDTDLQTDYFDKGRVRLFEDHPLYKEARAMAEKVKARRDLKYAAKRAAHEAYMQARLHPETVNA